MPVQNLHEITTKDELVELFVDCVNTMQPEHYYTSENPYPITKENVNVGYCRSDGPYWAKCGPRNAFGTLVTFSPNTPELTSLSPAQLLAVLTHEAAHIQEGLHNGPAHSKRFWRCMAFLAWQMRENSQYIADTSSQVTVAEEDYIREIVNDPNEFTVDGRIETVHERRKEMAELLGVEL